MRHGAGDAAHSLTYQGEHNQAGCRSMARLGFGSGIAVGGALILLVECWPEGMCLLFGIGDSATRTLACLALRIYGLGALFCRDQYIAVQLLSGPGTGEGRLRPGDPAGGGSAAALHPPVRAPGAQGILVAVSRHGDDRPGCLRGLGVFGALFQGGDPGGAVFQRTILSNTRDVGEVCQELEAFCRSWDASARQCYFTTMTLEELSVAILQHGFTGRTDGYIQITAIAQPNGSLSSISGMTRRPSPLQPGDAAGGGGSGVRYGTAWACL